MDEYSELPNTFKPNFNRSLSSGTLLELKKGLKKYLVKLSDGKTVEVKGRNAQVLRVLMLSQFSGATGLDFSKATTAFRYSNCLVSLRKMGFDIETKHEKAGDCVIGRYFLKGKLEIFGG